MVYGRHFHAFFGTMGNVNMSTCAQYGPYRLGHALPTTVNKELSALRGFLEWCAMHGYLLEAPAVPALPKKTVGTPYKDKRRGPAMEISEEEALAIIAKLDE